MPEPSGANERPPKLKPGCGAAIGAAGFTFAAATAWSVSVEPEAGPTWRLICWFLSLMAGGGWVFAALGWLLRR